MYALETLPRSLVVRAFPSGPDLGTLGYPHARHGRPIQARVKYSMTYRTLVRAAIAFSPAVTSTMNNKQLV